MISMILVGVKNYISRKIFICVKIYSISKFSEKCIPPNEPWFTAMSPEINFFWFGAFSKY